MWIMAAFILFWPIGIFLLYKKLSTEKGTVLRCHKTVAAISFILFGIGGIYLLLVLAGSIQFISFTVLWFIGGCVMHVYARNIKTKSDRYRKYIDLIINKDHTSLDNISFALGIAYDEAVTDLQKMISAGYFTGWRIDHTQRAIVYTMPQFVDNPFENPSARPLDRVIHCESCGANNKIAAGRVPKCEYCDSPL